MPVASFLLIYGGCFSAIVSFLLPGDFGRVLESFVRAQDAAGVLLRQFRLVTAAEKLQKVVRQAYDVPFA